MREITHDGGPDKSDGAPSDGGVMDDPIKELLELREMQRELVMDLVRRCSPRQIHTAIHDFQKAVTDQGMADVMEIRVPGKDMAIILMLVAIGDLAIYAMASDFIADETSTKN